MKDIITILLCTITIFNCTSQNKVTFQDNLSDYISKKKYLSNGYSNIEYSNKSGIYTNFWYKKNKKSYLIFVKNEEIYFVLDCGLLPVGDDSVGRIKKLSKNEFKNLKKLSFSYVVENVMNEYPEDKKTTFEDFSEIKKYLPYEECLDVNKDIFLAIEVELEVPVVFLRVEDGSLIMSPLEE